MIARLTVQRGTLTEYPLAERVRGGWQNGVTFYADETVTNVTPVTLASHDDQCEAEYVVGAAAYTDCGCADRLRGGSVMDDDTRVAEIRQRAGAASGAPWVTDYPKHSENGLVSTLDGDYAVADIFGTSADAEFIAHAREDVPWLVAEREALLDRLRATEAERIECARCGGTMIRQDEHNTPFNTAMEVCSRCCFQIHDGLTTAAEARAAEAEAAITEAQLALEGESVAFGTSETNLYRSQRDAARRALSAYRAGADR